MFAEAPSFLFKISLVAKCGQDSVRRPHNAQEAVGERERERCAYYSIYIYAYIYICNIYIYIYVYTYVQIHMRTIFTYVA